MNACAEAGVFAAVRQNADGITSSVLVEIPAIAFTGEGQSSILPAVHPSSSTDSRNLKSKCPRLWTSPSPTDCSLLWQGGHRTLIIST
jgi:hypothetical protein